MRRAVESKDSLNLTPEQIEGRGLMTRVERLQILIVANSQSFTIYNSVISLASAVLWTSYHETSAAVPGPRGSGQRGLLVSKPGGEGA